MYSFTFIVSLDQEVNLSRDLNLKGTASTWSVVATGAALPEDLDKLVAQYAEDLYGLVHLSYLSH